MYFMIWLSDQCSAISKAVRTYRDDIAHSAYCREEAEAHYSAEAQFEQDVPVPIPEPVKNEELLPMTEVKHLFFRFWYGPPHWGIRCSIYRFEFKYTWFPRNYHNGRFKFGLEFARVTLFWHSLVYTRSWDRTRI